MQSLAQAQTLQETLDETLEACWVAAWMSLCKVRLGQVDAALSTLNSLLERLTGDLTARPAHETINMRWTRLRALEALADERAAPLLEQLHADVQARAAELTDAADRDRLIQAIPNFRDSVAAHGRRGGQNLAR